jgi:hypothetical protein
MFFTVYLMFYGQELRSLEEELEAEKQQQRLLYSNMFKDCQVISSTYLVNSSKCRFLSSYDQKF